jgi:hypothetical protein
VDIGADEYCDEGSSNFADFNDDDIVDTDDLCELAGFWLADANDPSWDETYDLYDSDFAYFAQEWLWMTCDMMQDYEMTDMLMGMGSSESMAMMTSMEFGFTSLAKEPTLESEPDELSTSQLVSLVEGIHEIIKYVEMSIEEGYENTDDLLEMKDFLEDVLQDLQEGI